MNTDFIGSRFRWLNPDPDLTFRNNQIQIEAFLSDQNATGSMSMTMTLYRMGKRVDWVLEKMDMEKVEFLHFGRSTS